MTYSTDSLKRFVTNVRTELKIWLQLLSFRPPMPAERQSRDIVVAFFLSVVIHSFLAYLLWVVIIDRTAVEPSAPAIDTPLILSLSTFTTASHDEMDREAVPTASHSEPHAQHSQYSPERSRSAEHMSEDETFVTSKRQVIPGLKAQEEKFPAVNATSTLNLEAASPMVQEFETMPEFESIPEFERMPEFKTETVVKLKAQGILGAEFPGDKSLADYLAPSFGLEAVYRFEREFGRVSESEAQNRRIKSGMLYVEKYKAEVRALNNDCGTVYAKNGLFAIPKLIMDAITGNGCKWGQAIE